MQKKKKAEKKKQIKYRVCCVYINGEKDITHKRQAHVGCSLKCGSRQCVFFFCCCLFLFVGCILHSGTQFKHSSRPSNEIALRNKYDLSFYVCIINPIDKKCSFPFHIRVTIATLTLLHTHTHAQNYDHDYITIYTPKVYKCWQCDDTIWLYNPNKTNARLVQKSKRKITNRDLNLVRQPKIYTNNSIDSVPDKTASLSKRTEKR